MTIPYTQAFAATLLRRMTDDQLARVTPERFQTIPLVKVLPWAIGRELIDAERAMRRGRGCHPLK